jgi:hypothetical protein
VTEYPSSVPTFAILGATFCCWTATDADGGQRYVWRSTCGRFAVGRRGRLCWARSDGRIVGGEFDTMKLAMIAAVGAAREAA